MATEKEIQEQLLDSVQQLATKATNATPRDAARLSYAANNLAEAYAWIYSPSHEHGGSSYSEA